MFLCSLGVTVKCILACIFCFYFSGRWVTCSPVDLSPIKGAQPDLMGEWSFRGQLPLESRCTCFMFY